MIIGLKRKTKLLVAIVTIVPLVSLIAFNYSQPVQGATCNWTGGSGSWETGTNWSCGAAPTSADDVTIDANVTVTINATTTINSFTLGNSGGTTSPTLNFAYDAVASGALIIDDGNFIAYSGTTITHSDASGATINGKINVDVQSGNTTLNGTINTDYKGYSGGGVDQAGYGPGGGARGNVGNGCSGPGAGHGGKGGHSECYSSGGLPYGSVSAPDDLGSGGNGGEDAVGGGDGGGTIKISTGGSLSISGTLSANGANGGYDGGSEDGGGGSGGSIWLSANSLMGSGSLSVNGGTGQTQGGGGSGGRIALYYASSSFTGTISTEPGSGQNYGGVGTIYKKLSSETYGDLLVDSAISGNTGAILCESDNCSGTNTPTYNDVTIDNYGILTHYENTSTQTNWLQFTADNIVVNTNAQINTNAKGYSGSSTNSDGNGPGGGTRAVNNGHASAGAGHGGEGGDSQQRAGGLPYGTISTPNQLGSGGGGVYDQNAKGGNGGGYAKLIVNNTLTLNGTLTGNGSNGATDPDGGSEDSGSGSGGSIWINTNTITGNGTITSNGGTSESPGGSGSGGRVAIYYTTDTYSGTIQVEPGSGYEYGGLGTVFKKVSSESYGDLIIDSAISANKGAILCGSDICSGTFTPTFDDITITNYGNLTHLENTTTQVNWLEFTTDTLTINTNAKVNLDYKGYSGQWSNTDGNGPGGGDRAINNGWSASGAGYGGDGGNSTYRTGGIPYGSIDTPHDLGSGGAGVYDQNAKGGNGGGYAKLTINETLTVNGALSVNGQNGGADPDTGPEDAGAGSGGSLWLNVNTITGTGTISSNGGTADVSGGAGAGGRMAIYYTTNSFSGSLQTEPGNGAQYGGLGTIFLKESTETYGDLLIDSAISSNKGAIICDDDTCDGTVNVTYDDVTIDNYGILSHRENSDTKTNWLTFTADSLTINTNAKIDTDYRGYTGGAQGQYGNGPGGGRYPGNQCSALGGGHGGPSGNSNCYEGNTPSGTVDTPNELGSGGGGGEDSGNRGGDGGGMIQITINDTTTVTGTISANGGNGQDDNTEDAGGGSGGSIYLTTGTLTGTGTIQADGGTGDSHGGGGGGGRIAYHFTTNSFSGTTSVEPGTGYSSGGTGTIFLKEQSHTYGDLHISNTTANKGTMLCTNNVCDGTVLHRFEDVFISNSGILTHPTNSSSQTYWLRVAAENMTLSDSSKIELSGQGYNGGATDQAGQGPGAGGPGNVGNGCSGCGGGFGGEGGRSDCYDSGGSAYGSSNDVSYIGSGGNGGEDEPWATGGDGGGLIELTISDTLTVNSGIYANGTNAGLDNGEDGGGGSGGGIAITTDVLTGSGTIEATGGTSGIGGGGGSGGRIKIAYQTNSWTGNTLNPATATTGGTGYDTGDNGTVQLNAVTQGYIVNADAEIDVQLSSDWSTNLEDSGNQQISYTGVGVENTSNTRIAEFTLFFDGNRDFSNVTAASSGTESFFHVTGGFSNIDGYDALYDTYSLYVLKGVGNVVGVCPGATSLGEVDKNCAGLTFYNAASSNVSIVNIGGSDYWKIDGLTSTGGFSVLDNMYDNMDRLQISTASNHEIVFTTTNGVDANTDTITVEFDPASQAWNLGSITQSDIDLEDDGTDVTLAATPAAGVWGVNINTTTDIITFTAPTDAGSGEIADDSVLTIKIGTNADGGSNQIVNPSTAGQYEIEARMNTTNDEFGFVEIAIVDDDTININSFIDSFLLFDIDTSETDEDCDAAGGTAPCDSHGGSTDDSGYTIDLGEMSILTVNDSGDSVVHADSLTGAINYIYFDLSTNASSGAAVTLISANGALNGSDANTIPSVTNDGDGVTISAGDGAYGIREVSNSATSGSFTIAGDYNGGSSVYGECSTSATQIFSTSAGPMDTGRLQMAIGASPSNADGTGTYTDTLTFIVTSTF